GGTVVRSTDGTTWEVVPGAPSGLNFADVAFAESRFVATRSDFAVLREAYTSIDGGQWALQSELSVGQALNGVAHGNGVFVVVGRRATVHTASAGPFLTAIEVEPASTTVITGETTPVVVEAVYSDGSVVDVADQAIYDSSDESVA